MSQVSCPRNVSVPKTRGIRRLRERKWPHPPRRDPHTRVIAQLLELAGPESSVIATSCRPWASATFTGARHRIIVRFAGCNQREKASRFAQALPEAEFSISGHIVADACVDTTEENTSSAGHDQETHLQLSILTIEDW